jgi:hypothetical protein
MTRLVALVALILGLGLGLGPCAAAHEVRPAYLEIDQVSADTYRVTWKRPTMGDVAVHLVPHLSNGWLETPPADQYAAAGFLIRVWSVHARGMRPLEGQVLSIEGLSDTITDVFVRIRPLRGDRVDAIVRPESPSLTLTLARGAGMGARSFLLLGIEHILTGPDHLLFVLGLILIVRDRLSLLKTASAFTLAHSLTLAAASFGLISLPPELLNTLIALSILFVAPEALRAQAGGTSLTIRYPWCVAFAFGLLHGMGFASGLTSLGLERGPLLIALVLFNCGVEIGQIAFIAFVLALRRGFRLMEVRWPRPLALAPTYAIGGFGAAWVLQYGFAVFAGAP